MPLGYLATRLNRSPASDDLVNVRKMGEKKGKENGSRNMKKERETS